MVAHVEVDPAVGRNSNGFATDFQIVDGDRQYGDNQRPQNETMLAEWNCARRFSPPPEPGQNEDRQQRTAKGSRRLLSLRGVVTTLHDAAR